MTGTGSIPNRRARSGSWPAALSEAADSETDLDPRTWHRAEAAIVADEELASELQHAAERASGGGGPSQ